MGPLQQYVCMCICICMCMESKGFIKNIQESFFGGAVLVKLERRENQKGRIPPPQFASDFLGVIKQNQKTFRTSSLYLSCEFIILNISICFTKPRDQNSSFYGFDQARGENLQQYSSRYIRDLPPDRWRYMYVCVCVCGVFFWGELHLIQKQKEYFTQFRRGSDFKN